MEILSDYNLRIKRAELRLLKDRMKRSWDADLLMDETECYAA